MNIHSKRATFSPDQEKSNVQENFQNCCRGRAGGWDTGRRWRSPQENRTTVAYRGVLRIADAPMPGQPWLSRRKEVTLPKFRLVRLPSTAGSIKSDRVSGE
jgi:hypothetical protein